MSNLIHIFDQDLKRADRELRRSRKRLFNGRCAYCRKHHNHLTLDHFVPLYLNGRHSIENLLPACPDCNLAKDCQRPDMFFFAQPFFDIYQWQKILQHVGQEELNFLLEPDANPLGKVESLLGKPTEFFAGFCLRCH